MQETLRLGVPPGSKAERTPSQEPRQRPGSLPRHTASPPPSPPDPSTHLLVPAGGVQGDQGVAPVLGLAALLTDAAPIGVAEGDQWAAVRGAQPEVPVPGRLGQLVAMQPAVLLVRPQVLRAVVHHAGQAGLDGLHPAGPETEVTQDLLLLLQALCLGSPLPLRALSPSFPWGAPWGAQVLFLCGTGRARVWAESGRRVNGDPAQRAWSHQIQFSHVDGLLLRSWASSASGPRIRSPSLTAEPRPEDCSCGRTLTVSSPRGSSVAHYSTELGGQPTVMATRKPRSSGSMSQALAPPPAQNRNSYSSVNHSHPHPHPIISAKAGQSGKDQKFLRSAVTANVALYNSTGSTFLSSIFSFLGPRHIACVQSLSRVWLFATPWTISHQAPLSTGFPRQEYWSGLPFPAPGDFPNPGIELRSPTWQADTLPSEPPGKPSG